MAVTFHTVRTLSARDLWVNLHLYVALVVGIVLFALGATGALLSLKGPLLRWELGEKTLRVATREVPYAPVGEWVEHVRKTHPEIGPIFAITAPNASPLPTNAGLLTVMLNSGDIAFVTVDPYTAEPIGLFLYRGTFFFKILDLHRSLLMSNRYAASIVAWCGIALLFSLSTGLYLWWPRRGRWREGFIVSVRAKGTVFLRQLHSVAAAWIFLPLFLVALSGVAIAKPEWAQFVIGRFSSVHVTDPMQGYMTAMHHETQTASCGEPTSFDAAVSMALQAAPGTAFASIGGGGPAPYSLRLKRADDISEYGDTEVIVDSKCPRVLHLLNSTASSAGDSVFNAIRPLHGHLLLGWLGRFVVLLTGLVLPALFVTGVLFWMKRSLPRWRRRSAN